MFACNICGTFCGMYLSMAYVCVGIASDQEKLSVKCDRPDKVDKVLMRGENIFRGAGE